MRVGTTRAAFVRAKIVNFLFSLCVSLSLITSIQPAHAGPVYVAGAGGELGTLDLTTGAFTSIGNLNLDTGDLLFGLGFGADGKLYGIDSSLSAHLFLINTTNAHTTDLGTIGTSSAGSGAGADDHGRFYTLSQGVGSSNTVASTLYPPSTTLTTLGNTGIIGDGLVAPNSAGQVFVSIFNPMASSDDLGSLNIATGAVTDIGSTGFFLYSGLFIGGTLYGFGSNGEIVIVNTTTGAATQVGTYHLPNGDAIFASATFHSVPEPSSLALASVALLMFGSVRWFRNGTAATKVAV